jgi:hypothetical protein
MKSSMTLSDTHWHDYKPSEIPSDLKKNNYKQMKCPWKLLHTQGNGYTGHSI